MEGPGPVSLGLSLRSAVGCAAPPGDAAALSFGYLHVSRGPWQDQQGDVRLSAQRGLRQPSTTRSLLLAFVTDHVLSSRLPFSWPELKGRVESAPLSARPVSTGPASPQTSTPSAWDAGSLSCHPVRASVHVCDVGRWPPSAGPLEDHAPAGYALSPSGCPRRCGRSRPAPGLRSAPGPPGLGPAAPSSSEEVKGSAPPGHVTREKTGSRRPRKARPGRRIPGRFPSKGALPEGGLLSPEAKGGGGGLAGLPVTTRSHHS